MRKTLVLTLLLFGAIAAQAINVRGHVKDAITKWPIRGAIVTLARPGLPVEQRVTLVDGFYDLDVKAGERGTLHFAMEGRPSRYVVVDASKVPKKWTDELSMEVEMHLFPWMDGLDSALISAPAGVSVWDPVDENMVWDTATIEPLIQRRKELVAAYLLAHPEEQPTTIEKVGVWCFELVKDWGGLLMWPVVLLLYGLLRFSMKHLRRMNKIMVLLALLGIGIYVLVDLAHAGGPLRYVALIAVFLILIAGGYLVSVLFFVPPDKGDIIPDDTDYDDDLSVSGPVAENRGSRWVAVIFFSAVGAAGFGSWKGLENTLDVWPMVRGALGAGLAIACIIAWLRTPSGSRQRIGFLLRAGSVWWIAAPLFALALASFVNRMFPAGDTTCNDWLVTRISESRRNHNIWLTINGQEERLEMPRTLKQELTTLDSLRCCHQRGALGFVHVYSIDRIGPDADPR